MVDDMYLFEIFVRKDSDRTLKWYCRAYDVGNNEVLYNITAIF